MSFFKVERKKFLKSLQNLSLIVKENKTRPSISGALFQLNNNNIEVRGTDLDINILDKIDAQVSKKDCFVIKLNTFQDYIKELNDKHIEIEKKDNVIEVKGLSSKSEFNIFDFNDFPEYQNVDYKKILSISSSKLIQGLDHVMIGANNLSDNLSVNCIRMDIEDNKMNLVTSDGYRLFLYKLPVEYKEKMSSSIPFRTASILSRLIKSNDTDEIDIFRSENQISFNLANLSINSKTIELPYPDYNSIFNSLDFKAKVTCNADELISALKRVQIFARENIDSKNGALFTFGKNTLNIETSNDTSHILENLDIKNEGEEIKIFLNVKFVLDFLNQISDDVTIELKDSNSALLLKQDNKDNFSCLIMPLAYNN